MTNTGPTLIFRTPIRYSSFWTTWRLKERQVRRFTSHVSLTTHNRLVVRTFDRCPEAPGFGTRNECHTCGYPGTCDASDDIWRIALMSRTLCDNVKPSPVACAKVVTRAIFTSRFFFPKKSTTRQKTRRQKKKPRVQANLPEEATLAIEHQFPFTGSWNTKAPYEPSIRIKEKDR